ncbi:MAG: hypothetical protein HYY18_03990 [Planctomycetes bacterium]|nr:hypothetical protein [Planctomycetota bacterium]
MRRTLALFAVCAALPLFADDKPKPDNKEQVGVDHVTVYFCPCINDHWSQISDEDRKCPFKGCEEHPKCGDFGGDYKIVVRAPRDSVRAGQEVSMDVEVYEVVVDKDSKPDEVRLKDVTSVKVRFTPGEDKDGEFEAGDPGPVIEGVISGPNKVAVVKNTFAKKGEYLIGIEILRSNKGKTKIESEIRFTVD